MKMLTRLITTTCYMHKIMQRAWILYNNCTTLECISTNAKLHKTPCLKSIYYMGPTE